MTRPLGRLADQMCQPLSLPLDARPGAELWWMDLDAYGVTERLDANEHRAPL